MVLVGFEMKRAVSFKGTGERNSAHDQKSCPTIYCYPRVVDTLGCVPWTSYTTKVEGACAQSTDSNLGDHHDIFKWEQGNLANLGGMGAA